MDRSSKPTNNNSFESNYPIHQMQEDQGVKFTVIDNDIARDTTNSYYEQIRQPNGDIHLRLVDIFNNNSKNNSSRPQVSQQEDDQVMTDAGSE